MNLLFQQTRAAKPGKSLRPSVSLACEPLEAREVPAGGFPGPGPTIDQTLRITGTPQHDTIVVDPMPWGMLRIRITTRADLFDAGTTTEQTLRQLPYIRMHIDAGAGTDKVHNNTSLPSTILGGAGNDILAGGSASDTLRGGTNSSDYIDMTFDPHDLMNDYLYGRGGDDWLYGEGNADQLFGGEGVDHLYGGAAADFLMGEAHDDWLYGEAGDDQLFGGEGADHLYGGDNSDFLMGEGGADYYSGDAGDDTLFARGDGIEEEIWTGSGNDIVVPDWHPTGLIKALDEMVQDFDEMHDSFRWD